MSKHFYGSSYSGLTERFLVLEGCNGVGKTTLANAIAVERNAVVVQELDPMPFLEKWFPRQAFYLAEYLKIIKVLLIAVFSKRRLVIERCLLSPITYERTLISQEPSLLLRLSEMILVSLANKLSTLKIVVITLDNGKELRRRHGDRYPEYSIGELELLNSAYCDLAGEQWLNSLKISADDTPEKICQMVRDIE
jgi:thymidylate kinase